MSLRNRFPVLGMFCLLAFFLGTGNLESVDDASSRLYARKLSYINIDNLNGDAGDGNNGPDASSRC